MANKSFRIGILFPLIITILFVKSLSASDYDPRKSARYDTAVNILTFIQITDPHIGTEKGRALEYQDMLKQFFNWVYPVIKPSIVINTGDLTDGTDSTWFCKQGFPRTQQKDEWLTYESITTWQDSAIYFDIPGNHDRNGDPNWSYYTTYSVLGKKIKFDSSNPVGQFSTTITLPNNDSYLFIGANTCDRTGVENNGVWTVSSGVSDYPDLSAVERGFIAQKLDDFKTDPNHKLSFIFGHAPIYRLATIGQNPKEWVLNELGDIPAERNGFGGPEFVSLLNQYNVSAYIFGHLHFDSYTATNRDIYDVNSAHNLKNIRLVNTNSITEQHTYRIVAIDNNGVTSRAFDMNEWPIAMITSPLDAKAGGLENDYITREHDNPYHYPYPLRSDSTNFVRALAYDPSGISQVTFRYTPSNALDSSGNFGMNKISDTSNVWQGTWDCSSLEGDYILSVDAVGGYGTTSNSIRVKIDNNKVFLRYPGNNLKGELQLQGSIYREIINKVIEANFFYSTDNKATWHLIGKATDLSDPENIEIAFNSQTAGITSGPVWFKMEVVIDNTPPVVTIAGYGDKAAINDTNYETIIAYSDTSSIIDNISPTVPTNLFATPVANDWIELKWNASSDDYLAGYKIYRNTNPTVDKSNYDQAFDGIDTATFIDNFTNNETTYYYKVLAYDLAGNESGLSNIAFAVPDSLAPFITVKDLNNTVVFDSGFTSSVILNIFVDDSTHGSGISQIEVRKDNDSTGSVIFSDTTDYGTSHVYESVSINSQGEGGIYVKVLDIAGNQSSVNFTLDITSPTIISLKSDTTEIPSGGYTRFDSISVTAYDSLSGLKEIKLTGPSSFNTSFTGETDTVSVTFDSLLDGYYTVSVSDQAYNSTITSFAIGTMHSGVFNTFPPDGFITNMNYQDISASIYDSGGLNITTIKIEIEGKTATVIKDVEKYTNDTRAVEIRYQPKAAELLEEGLNKWKVIGKDLAGNDINDSTHILIVDTEPPVIEIISPISTTLKEKEWFK